ILNNQMDIFYVNILFVIIKYFFFQAEDGIRDRNVTGVQTCALPISFQTPTPFLLRMLTGWDWLSFISSADGSAVQAELHMLTLRSEERRVGKEGRSRW